MTELTGVTKGKTNKPPTIVLYGPHGIGKSSFAVGGKDGESMPAPIYLPTEDGLGQIEADKFPVAKTWTELIGYIGELATKKHNYKTLVIDTLDWAERLIHKEVALRECVESIENIGYQAGYKYALKYWDDLLKSFSYLRDEKNMIILALAHSNIVEFKSPETENYDRYDIDLHKHAVGIVHEWADMVLFANERVYTNLEDAGFGKKEAKGRGQGERVMFTERRPAFEAKNRYSLPAELPLSWSALSAALIKPPKVSEKKVVQTNNTQKE